MSRWGRVTGVVVVTVWLGLLPWSPASRAAAGCASGTTLLVAAHPDDDLLTMSPDLLHEIRSDRCVRTLYLTAGNANLGQEYWSMREAGVKAAYASMAGVRNAWRASDAGLRGHRVPVFTLAADPSVSLEFLRLPDGLRTGTGGSANGYESLQKLWQGRIDAVHPVDGSGRYTRSSLVAALTATMTALRPGRIITMDFLNSYGSGDHSDHYSAGYFTAAAQRRYARPHRTISLMGYPATGRPANVSGADLEAKSRAYFAYAQHDPRVCDSEQSCAGQLGGLLLERRYRAVSVTGTVHPNELRGLGSARQVVTVTAPTRSSPDGTAVAWQARRHVWHVVDGPTAARLGARGLVLPGHPRQLTGKTPIGAFRPARALGFAPDPGTRLPYTRLTGNDYWPYDPRAPRTYNVFQPHRSGHASWRRTRAEHFAEHARRYPAALLLDFNLPRGIHHSRARDQMQARRPADVRRGSLFVHAGGTAGRLGWLSLPAPRVEQLLRWMRPRHQKTTFVIGTPGYLRHHRL